jgi:hypothetical protein
MIPRLRDYERAMIIELSAMDTVFQSKDHFRFTIAVN